jgi:hypothetical protein
MNEFNINLVGKEDNIKKEEIFNNFDFNYLPMNNLPISYFPLNNPVLSNELKNKDIDSISDIRTNDFISNFNDLITYTSGYLVTQTSKLLVYKNTGTLVINKDITCDILLVGGGGGGAWYGGGGGGGMVTKISDYILTSGSYNINIGNGGRGGTEGAAYGLKGGATSINFNGSDLFKANGGGGGGQKASSFDEYPIIYQLNGKTYSGGIGGNSPLVLSSEYGRTTAVNNNGNTIGGLGGSGYVITHKNLWKISTGGGGGAGNTDKIGNNGLSGSSDKAGNGGNGLQDDITGTILYYGGGGGGGALNVNTSIGGKGGGGNGNGNIGTINTGGGGGGGGHYQNGGDGGSGIIIIKIKHNFLDTNNKTITFIEPNTIIKITKDINVDLLLVGGGGGGAGGGKILNNKDQYLYNGGGGGGGEVIYLKDYNFKKGVYDINIGIGGIGGTGGIGDFNSGADGNNGKDTYIMKDNNKFLISRGGNKGNGGTLTNNFKFLGGTSHKNSYGKGADGNVKTDNSKVGEYINIEGSQIYYGNGGLNAKSPDLYGNQYRLNNGGYGGKGGDTNENSSGKNGGTGSNGIFILKYNNNDIEFIKRYITDTTDLIYKSSIDNRSIGISFEPTTDNANYKLLVYRNAMISNNLILNKDIICDILIVGGGGCGGTRHGGGGGGGAVIYLQNQQLNRGTYSIQVGGGGTSNVGILYGNKGIDSIITFNSVNIYKALGGGGGYHTDEIFSKDGGSGGGGGGTIGNSLVTNIPRGNYGNNGGIGTSGDQESYWGGGGGGGASLTGYNAVLNGALSMAGNGGDGTKISITGTPIYYGGGGGGGVALNGKSAGLGGKGGGGNGGKGTNAATPGMPNTGGGGGGSGFNGNTNGQSGIGGSGIVIFRVKKEDIESGISKDDLYKNIDKDTRIINDIKDEFKKKLKGFENNDMPYNKFSIFPLVILIILVWLFIFLFLLKFVHHYFVNIYLYILLSIIIFLLLFGSMWFLYSNNDL